MIRKVQWRAQQIVSGFKSPADDYLEGRLEVSDLLIVDPHSTFYFRMGSDAMNSFGLAQHDILIVDRSLKPVNGTIVIVAVAGELICRCISYKGKVACLFSDEGRIEANEDGFDIWGVVTASCKNVLPNALRKGRYANVCAL